MHNFSTRGKATRNWKIFYRLRANIFRSIWYVRGYQVQEWKWQSRKTKRISSTTRKVSFAKKMARRRGIFLTAERIVTDLSFWNTFSTPKWNRKFVTLFRLFRKKIELLFYFSFLNLISEYPIIRFFCERANIFTEKIRLVEYFSIAGGLSVHQCIWWRWPVV